MQQYCRSIYCGQQLSEGVDVCSYCTTNQQPGSPPPGPPEDFALKGIVDMHQIIPNQPGAIENQVKWMNKIGISKALLQSVPDKVGSIYNNAMLRQVQERHPGRFFISQFMDPRHPMARRKIRKYAANGNRIIKLLPCLGYQPDDKKYDTFWKEMENLRLVGMVHTGFITARHKQEEFKHKTFLNSNFGNPLFFDMIARKFPDLQIILCHMGGSIWYEEACQMINQHTNVWGDISGFGYFALDRILQLDIALKWEKVFWGNDSHPDQYGVHLRLLRSKLEQANRADLLPGLLRDHGVSFANQFLT